MNSTASQVDPTPLGFPSGLVPLPLVQEEVKWLLLITTYTAFLVPIAIVLFFFSTPQLRGRPVFILNVCTLAIGFGQGILGISTSVNTISLNLPATPRTSVASMFLFICVPFCVQGILVLRVCAAYPPKRLSYTRIFAIYGPIVVFKLARGANIGYWIFHLQQAIKDSGGFSTNTTFTVSQASWNFPGTKAEWLLQLFDDTFVSTLFILRLRRGAGMQGTMSRVEVLQTSSSQNSYIQRLKTLFWAAVFNFVFPVIFNIALITLVFRDHDFIHGSYLLYTNNYVQIIGVLLATVFVAGRQGDLNDESPAHGHQLGHNHRESAYATRIAWESVGSSHSNLEVVDVTKSRGHSGN